MRKNNDVCYSQKNKYCIRLLITDSAASYIKYLIKNNPGMLGIRINIEKSGCAGFSYKIEKAVQEDVNDLVYENNGAKLYISQKIIPLINGTKLDFVKDGLNYMFKFDNPNAKAMCGCGDSFNI